MMPSGVSLCFPSCLRQSLFAVIHCRSSDPWASGDSPALSSIMLQESRCSWWMLLLSIFMWILRKYTQDMAVTCRELCILTSYFSLRRGFHTNSEWWWTRLNFFFLIFLSEMSLGSRTVAGKFIPNYHCIWFQI